MALYGKLLVLFLYFLHKICVFSLLVFSAHSKLVVDTFVITKLSLFGLKGSRTLPMPDVVRDLLRMTPTVVCLAEMACASLYQ